jgi:hypothetical protein
LEDQKRNFLVVGLVERKGGKPKQTVSVKCTKIIGFWLRNSSAPAGADRKLSAAQLQNIRRPKAAISGFASTAWIPGYSLLRCEQRFREQQFRFVKDAYRRCFSD